MAILGTGDSGKSTFLKQMKIINKDGFTKSETDRYEKLRPWIGSFFWRTDLVSLDAIFQPSVPLYSGTFSATIMAINLIYANLVLPIPNNPNQRQKHDISRLVQLPTYFAR